MDDRSGTELFREAMRRSDAREYDAFLDLFSPDVTWAVPGATLEGREAVRAWLGAFAGGFSSYRHDVACVVEAGRTVCGEGTWTGTHDGPLATPAGEVPPTGRTITFRWAMLAELDESARQLRSARVYFDQLELMGQLGLLPEPATASG